MRRDLLVGLSIAGVLLVATGVVAWRVNDPPRPPRIDVVEQNQANPMTAEMACIDGVMQDRNLKGNEVQARLDACEGSVSNIQ